MAGIRYSVHIQREHGFVVIRAEFPMDDGAYSMQQFPMTTEQAEDVARQLVARVNELGMPMPPPADN